MRLEQLYDVRWELIKQAAIAWFVGLDMTAHKAPSQVVMGIAINFILVCERFGLNPREVLTVTDRVIRRSREHTPQYVRGMEQYLREEIGDA